MRLGVRGETAGVAVPGLRRGGRFKSKANQNANAVTTRNFRDEIVAAKWEDSCDCSGPHVGRAFYDGVVM